MKLKELAKITTIAAGAFIGSAAVAQADCYVTDKNSRGMFGDARYTRTFSGDSASTIWNRYCKPFIQNEVATRRISSGTFGMRCTGRLTCNIEGRIENGRVITTRQDFGDGAATRVQPEPRVERRVPTVSVERQPPAVARTVEPRIVPEARPAIRENPPLAITATPPSRSNGIFTDPGWRAFDRLVADCESSRAAGGSIFTAPTPRVTASPAPRAGCR